MQLAKVELFGINICGQQRYSNNNNNSGTNNNNCKSIGRNNDRPVLFVFVFVVVLVCVCICVCLGVGSCAHCVLIVWVRSAFSNLFCGLCNLFSLTLHGPNVCESVCVCKCFVYVCHPMINSMAARNMEIKTQQQSLHPPLQLLQHPRLLQPAKCSAWPAPYSEQRAH